MVVTAHSVAQLNSVRWEPADPPGCCACLSMRGPLPAAPRELAVVRARAWVPQRRLEAGGQGREEENTWFPWEVRTSGRQLGTKSQAAEIVSKHRCGPESSRNPTLPVLLCSPPPPGTRLPPIPETGGRLRTAPGDRCLRKRARSLLVPGQSAQRVYINVHPKHLHGRIIYCP